jgi:hypothetical protein
MSAAVLVLKLVLRSRFCTVQSYEIYSSRLFGSSVGTVTGYELAGRGSILGNYFLAPYPVAQPDIQWVPETLFFREKERVLRSDHSQKFTMREFIPPLPPTFHFMVLTHGNNFSHCW